MLIFDLHDTFLQGIIGAHSSNFFDAKCAGEFEKGPARHHHTYALLFFSGLMRLSLIQRNSIGIRRKYSGHVIKERTNAFVSVVDLYEKVG